jgi:hypothetical protein
MAAVAAKNIAKRSASYAQANPRHKHARMVSAYRVQARPPLPWSQDSFGQEGEVAIRTSYAGVSNQKHRPQFARA